MLEVMGVKGSVGAERKKAAGFWRAITQFLIWVLITQLVKTHWTEQVDMCTWLNVYFNKTFLEIKYYLLLLLGIITHN